MAPTANVKPGNGVQNDRIGLSRIESDTVGLPVKPVVFSPKRWPILFDSDPRLKFDCPKRS